MDIRYNDPKYATVLTNLKTRLKVLRNEVKEDDAQYTEIERVVRDYWNSVYCFLGNR